MNDTETKEPIDRGSPEPVVRRAGRLGRFFFMQEALHAAEAAALHRGQSGFSEYCLASALLEAAEQIDDIAERVLGSILLFQQATQFAACGIAFRKRLLNPSDESNSEHAIQSSGNSCEANPLDARTWEAVLGQPQVAATWVALPEADRERVTQVVLHGVTAELAASQKRDLLSLKLQLAKMARCMAACLRDETRAPFRVRTHRRLRLGGLGLALSGLVALGIWADREFSPEPPGPANRALYKSVTISSNWRADAYPPEGIVDGETGLLGCHTQGEQNPWVQIDLGRKKVVSRVVVTNRLDGITERAVPLSIELSTNGRTYKEVARQTTDFKSWTATFPPTKTRYVRLTVLNATILHLNEVEVY